jgi:replicative DNA helicase
VKNLEKAPLFIDDTPSLSISIYGLKQDVWFRNTESIIIVDYLQLMTAGGNGRGRK